MYFLWKTNLINRQWILGARCTSHVTEQLLLEAITFVVLLEVHNTITKPDTYYLFGNDNNI